MKRVITLGEIMMRLSTPGFARFAQADQLQVVYGGSEANVAVSLASFGIPSEHVTRLPDHDLGQAVIQHLRKWQVCTDHIVTGEGRLGLYFLENGAMHRAPRIIYDRYHSAFASIQPGSIDWDAIMKEASWFHWTGITPAISQSAADVCREAVEAAFAHGVPVSGDINYRRNLWQYGQSPRSCMPALVEKCSVVVGGLTDFSNCLGIDTSTYEEGCSLVMKHYPAVKKISSTHRQTWHASHQTIEGMLWNGDTLLRSPVYDLTHIIDRVGAGDAYMAGLIYGWLTNRSDADTLAFATAACALKHTVEGDVNRVSVAEVDALVNGENTGKLLR